MLVNKILDLAINYFGKDTKLINHFLKVHSFARHMAIMENCDPHTLEVVEIAAILHDIGIPESIRKYNSGAGNWQEIEGPIIAEDLLKELNLEKNILERVLFIIGHHHTYSAIDGVDFQIIAEADFLVNVFEGEIEKPECIKIKENIFKTTTGIRLLDQLYL